MLINTQCSCALGVILTMLLSVRVLNGQCSEKLFNTIQARRFDSVMVSDDLKSAKLQRSFKADALMVTSNGQSVLNVCTEFGKYVKFKQGSY